MIHIKKVTSFLILFACFHFLTGCAPNTPDNFSRTIAGKWKFHSISGYDNKQSRKIGDDDFLVLSNSNGQQTFTYQIKTENLNASGTWSVNDSVLILSYTHNPETKKAVTITSSPEVIDEDEPDSPERANLNKIMDATIETTSSVRSFKITKLSSRTLAFEENGVTFKLTNSTAGIEGSITLNSIARGMLGLVCLIFILFLFSQNRRKIQWKLVVTGLVLQFIIAIGVLKVEVIKNAFEMMGNVFVTILSFTLEGSRFVFGDMVNPSGSIGFVFAFQILPTIIFFSALTSLLFYLGILQKIVYALAWIMSKTMKLSGAESLAAAANIFLGQTEAPLLVKPYIGRMTRSELLCLMTGGMATIAGGVMAAFIGFLGGDDPEMRLFFAKHLLAASVMSAPAAIVAAKILIPQTEKIDDVLVVSKERIGKNMLEAISIGTGEGLRLAVNVGAMLLVFIALIAMVNYILKDFIGDFGGINESIASFSNGRYDGLTMQFILGYVCAPLSWLMGVCKEDMVLVGQLLGEKTILNEFVAYTTLGQMQFSELFKEEKSIIIATYVLCGFANFASIGIQIGGIGSLAPEKRTTLSELGFRALLGGTMASLFTAVIVGMLI